jgi:hypothetical protein
MIYLLLPENKEQFADSLKNQFDSQWVVTSLSLPSANGTEIELQ